MVAQFVGLERRTSRAGKDSVDHAPGAHDDVSNSIAGVSALASVVRPPIPIVMPIIFSRAEARSSVPGRRSTFRATCFGCVPRQEAIRIFTEGSVLDD